MLQPLSTAHRRQAITKTVPAPIRGWNRRNSLDDMDPRDAVILDNWFPKASTVEVRRGCEENATGLGGSVETLVPYKTGTLTKLLGFANNNVYECSAAGAVGATLKAGTSTNRWQYVSFSNYAIMVSGGDTPQKYDGTTVSDTVITGSGLTPANLISVCSFKSRLFFVEKESMKVWYLPANAIAGAATVLDFSVLTSKGGYVMAVATWTRDGGSGASDDLFVVVTSNGEVIIYQGTDPSDATKWALVGVFNIGAPIGRRCVEKIGADLAIITVDGFIPLAKVLSSDRTTQQYALSDRIVNAVTEAADTYGANFGWQGILYAHGSMGIFNIPISSTVYHQYVINTTTLAWCRFIGMNAVCWAVLNDVLYFGGTDGKVYIADTGTSDNGTSIQADAKQAFNYFGNKGQNKQAIAVRPVIGTNGTLGLGVEINSDFTDYPPTSEATFDTSSGVEWDDVEWDVPDWGDDSLTVSEWLGVDGEGYCFAIYMRVVLDSLTVKWASTTWQYINISSL